MVVIVQNYRVVTKGSYSIYQTRKKSSWVSTLIIFRLFLDIKLSIVFKKISLVLGIALTLPR